MVVSNDSNYHKDGVEITNDLVQFLKDHQNNEKEYIICGVASIHRQAYPYAKKLMFHF